MAKHDHTPTPSTPITRRILALGAGAFSAIGIAAGAAALTAAGAATSPPSASADAEVIRVAAELVAQSRQIMAIARQGYQLVAGPEADRNYEAQVALVPRLHELEDELAELPARTQEGMRAKAEALRHRLLGDADEEGPELMNDDFALAWSLVQDVLGRA